MKNLYSAGFVAILLFTAQIASAQMDPPINQHPVEKPHLFSNLPEKFECNIDALQQLFNSTLTERTSVKFNNAIALKAVIAEKVQKGKDIISINLKLPEYEGALFNLSMISENGERSFVGRIVSRDHGDILILKKENDKYFFIKQQQKFTMVE